MYFWLEYTGWGTIGNYGVTTSGNVGTGLSEMFWNPLELFCNWLELELASKGPNSIHDNYNSGLISVGNKTKFSSISFSTTLSVDGIFRVLLVTRFRRCLRRSFGV